MPAVRMTINHKFYCNQMWLYSQTVHKMKDSDEDPILCSTCGKVFREKSSLNKHNREIHTCRLSGELFSSNNSIGDHFLKQCAKTTCNKHNKFIFFLQTRLLNSGVILAEKRLKEDMLWRSTRYPIKRRNPSGNYAFYISVNLKRITIAKYLDSETSVLADG